MDHLHNEKNMMIMRVFNDDKGRKSFTLIELIIVVAIIALFSGITMAYFNNFTREKQLSNNTKKLIDVVDLARKKTNSGDNSMCLGADGTSDGFSVVITGANSYKLEPVCMVGTPSIVTYQTESNVQFVNTSQRIDFKPLVPLDSGVQIILKEINLDKCLAVKIETSGSSEQISCSNCDNCNDPT